LSSFLPLHSDRSDAFMKGVKTLNEGVGHAFNGVTLVDNS
jgi:hypothetical protein